MLFIRLRFFLVYFALAAVDATFKLPVKIGYLITRENSKYNSTITSIVNRNNTIEGLQIQVDLQFRVRKLADVKSPPYTYAQVCNFLTKEKPNVVILTEECSPLCNQISELIIQANVPVIRADAGKLIRSIQEKSNSGIPNIFYLRPTIDDLEEALFRTIMNYQISKCVLLCEDGFCGMNYITKLSSKVKLIVQLLPDLGEDSFNKTLDTVMENIKESKIKQIVLQSSSQMAEPVIQSAMKHGIVNNQFIWIVTCLTEILKNQIENKAIFIFLRPSNISNVSDRNGFQLKTSYDEFLLEDAEGVIVCAVKEMALQVGVEKVLTLFQDENENSQNYVCANGEITPWKNDSLKNYISRVIVTGNSGVVGFTSDGRRLMETIDIVSPQPDGLVKLAVWYRQTENISVFTPLINEKEGSCILCNLTNAPLRVATLLAPPFIMKKYNSDSLTGNDKYEGFLVDLIEELSKRINFEYKLNVKEDGKYGIKSNGSWNGLIREIVDEEADIVLSDLTVSSSREEAVDFSVPYLYLGTNILMKKPSPSPSHPLSFLDPMSYVVWLSILASCLVVSVVLAIIGRFSPYDWRGLYQRDKVSSAEASHFNLMNSIWFVCAGLMQQGTEATPRSVSARIVGGTWWFFVLVIIASYTANMAAFLTVTNLHNPVESIEDLLSQNSLTYGIPNSGEVYAFFRDSHIEPYNSIFKKLKEADSFVDKPEDGIPKACEENFAFIYDSIFNIYVVNELAKCELMTVGAPFDSKGYGIAFPTDSKLKDWFSLHILKLKENEFIEGLKQKWDLLDLPKDGTSNTVGNAKNVLGMNQMSGIFFVLLIGTVLGILTSIMERIWFQAKKSSKKSKANNHHNHTLNVPEINMGEQGVKFL